MFELWKVYKEKLWILIALAAALTVWTLPVTVSRGAMLGGSSGTNLAAGSTGSVLATSSDAEKDSLTATSSNASAAGGFQELVLWLKDKERTDTVFTLTEDILWTERSYFFMESEVLIETNGYTITIPSGGVFYVSGDVTIAGGHSEKPMFLVKKGGGLFMGPDAVLEVTDGCGIQLEAVADARGTTEIYFQLYLTRIVVEGEGAVGIRGEDSLSLEYLNMEVGTGAAGIECRKGAALFLSEIRGDGESVKGSGAMTFDGCALSHAPEEGVWIDRTIQLVYQDGIFIWPNGDLPGKMNYAFTAKGYDTEFLSLPVEYLTDGADLGTPGSYEVTVVPEALPFESEIFVLPKNRIVCTVMEESKRYITGITAMYGRYYLKLAWLKPREEFLRLYYSIDGGANWREWELVNAENIGSGFLLDGKLVQSMPYLFQAVFTVNGEEIDTNLIEVYIGKNGITSKVLHGGRDDSIRDDGKGDDGIRDDSSRDPEEGDEPQKGGDQPGGDPSEGEKPGEKPSEGEKPGEDPSEGDKPGIKPSEGDKPGEKPSESDQPGEKPSEGDKPGEEPSESNKPGENPSGGDQTGEAPEGDNPQNGSDPGNGIQGGSSHSGGRKSVDGGEGGPGAAGLGAASPGASSPGAAGQEAASPGAANSGTANPEAAAPRKDGAQSTGEPPETERTSSMDGTAAGISGKPGENGDGNSKGEYTVKGSERSENTPDEPEGPAPNHTKSGIFVPKEISPVSADGTGDIEILTENIKSGMRPFILLAVSVFLISGAGYYMAFSGGRLLKKEKGARNR